MKTKQKMLKLMEYGLKPKTLSDLSESQINSLYLRLMETKKENNEQWVKKNTQGAEYTAPLTALKNGAAIPKPPVSGMETTVSIEGGNVKVTQAESELTEKFESKKQQKYFYSKCGDGKTKEQKKWCKMAKEFSDKTNFKKLPEKKKETKEGYLDIIGNAMHKNLLNKTSEISPGVKWEGKLEKQITKLLEDNMSPKMSKRDFLKLIYEMDSPGTKEKEPITKPRPDTKPSEPDIDYDPFNDPDPNDDPEARNPLEAPTKPDTKPKPVTEPKPDIDYDPFNDPDPNDDPEANQKGLSVFMKQVMNKGMLK